MIIDITRQLGLVQRSHVTREHAGKPAHVVVAARTYDTDIDDVWDAITSRERIPRWFTAVSGELRLGGRYQLEGNASGQITRCEQPHHLALTWEFAGGVSWVEVRLSPDPNGGTRLELEHIAHLDDNDPFTKKYGPGAVGVGWDLSLLGLALHLADASFDPKAGMEWSMSDDGKAFIKECAAAWGRAAIAGGAPQQLAEAAAANTAAFYCGEPEPNA